jgi:hypothetical protein
MVSPMSGFKTPSSAPDSKVEASIFVGTSLDGFIARTNGELDFLEAGGAVLLGRPSSCEIVHLAPQLRRSPLDGARSFDRTPPWRLMNG